MKRLLPILIFVVCLIGCAPSHRIIPRHDTARVPDHAVRDYVGITRSWEDLTISARPLEWNQIPGGMRRDFTIFEVTVENYGDKELRIELEQFALIDSRQMQRSPLLPSEVDRSLGRYAYPSQRISFGFGVSHGYRRSPYQGYRFGQSFHYSDGFPVYVEGQQTFLRAFQGGSILPKAQKQGWLYFSRVDDYDGNQLDLCFLVEGKIRLVFPFQVSRTRR